MTDRSHFRSYVRLMRKPTVAVAGYAFLAMGVLPAQTPPTTNDNPMAGLTIDGTNAAPAKPQVDDADAAAPQSFLGKFKGHLVVLKNGHLQPADPGALNGVKYVTILFAAGWRKPCRQYMQNFLPLYYSIKRKHPEYEMIFVDDQESADDMEHFMALFKMPWLAVRSEDISSGEVDVRPYEGDGSIPCLVLVDSSGKILSNSWVNGTWVGPSPVMEDTKKMLPESSEAP
jgi:nucleoredoxin